MPAATARRSPSQEAKLERDKDQRQEVRVQIGQRKGVEQGGHVLMCRLAVLGALAISSAMSTTFRRTFTGLGFVRGLLTKCWDLGHFWIEITHMDHSRAHNSQHSCVL